MRTEAERKPEAIENLQNALECFRELQACLKKQEKELQATEKREPGQNPGSRPPTVLRRKPARGRSRR